MIQNPAQLAWKSPPPTVALLAEHARLLQLHGPDSAALYEFEMKHLADAEFLQKAAEQKLRHKQWSQDRIFYRWCWLLIAALVLLQLSSILYIVYGRLHL